MADPYLPPTGVTPPYTGRTTTGDTVNPDTRAPGATSVRIEQKSGFGTGLMVALVFVVVAVMAYALYRPGDATPATTTNEGDVTIEQNATPAPAVPDANAGAVEPVTPPADPVTPPVADPAVPPTTNGTAPAAPANP